MTELEKQIKNKIYDSIWEWLRTFFSSYSNPLNKLCAEVFEWEREQVVSTLKKVMWDLVRTPEFEQTLREEFNRKIAKSLVWFLEWHVDKATNALKQDPTLKAKMIIAIENIVVNNIQ